MKRFFKPKVCISVLPNYSYFITNIDNSWEIKYKDLIHGREYMKIILFNKIRIWLVNKDKYNTIRQIFLFYKTVFIWFDFLTWKFYIIKLFIVEYITFTKNH